MSDEIAPLPMLRLSGGMIVRFEAVHPTTGAAVAGVVVSSGVIYGASDTANSGLAPSQSGDLLDLGWLSSAQFE